ncbi:MAG: NADPH-dependent FMN reductase [Streptococcus sp.]|nr:NADPH-dependent FMN reductase [Streptococcus sp.]
MDYLAIVGTNADLSYNRKLLQFMKVHFKASANIEIAEIVKIPIFDQPEERIAPVEVEELIQKIKKADGVIISTPEYDHSIPAALKNVLEWLSYVSMPLIKKPVMITGASYGSLGSSRAQAHLRQILDAPNIEARVMPGNEYLLGKVLTAFDEEGNLIDTQSVEELDYCFNEFVKFTKMSKIMDSMSDDSFESLMEKYIEGE